MLQTFRAKSLANVCHNEKAIDDLVENSLSRPEIEKVAFDSIMLLKQADTNHQGALPANVIRRRLQRCAALNLSTNEIAMLCQSLPRNSHGLCVYEAIPPVLYDVKFRSMKSMILQSQSSDIGNLLNRRLLQGIEKLSELNPESVQIRNGILSIRQVVEIMMDIPHLPLSRIQVVLIISEANVNDEAIDINQFVPIASRIIEQMFDPKVLQLKASTIQAQLPVGGEDSSSIQKRLFLLFNAYDLDFNGVLSYSELTECVNSLNLDLTPMQVKALVACAFPDASHDALR